MCGVCEGFFGQGEVCGIGQCVGIGFQFGDDVGIVFVIGDDVDVVGFIVVIFGGGVYYGWVVDVDVFDGIVECDISVSYSGLEGIKIYDYQIDVWNIVFGNGFVVFGQIVVCKDVVMYFGMQCFDVVIEYFGEVGVFGYIGNSEVGIVQQFGSIVGGKQFDVEGGEFFGEFEYVGFVGDVQQCLGYFGGYRVLVGYKKLVLLDSGVGGIIQSRLCFVSLWCKVL